MGNWYRWLNNTRFSGLDDYQLNNSKQWLNNIRDLVLCNSQIKLTDTVADIGTGTGLLGLKILEAQQGKGNVIFLDSDSECLEECKKEINKLNINAGYELINSDCNNIKISDNTIDKAVMRSVLAHLDNKQKCLSEIYRILKRKGTFIAFEPVISLNTKYWQILDPIKTLNFEELMNIENIIFSDEKESLFNYNLETLYNMVIEEGFTSAEVRKIDLPIKLTPDERLIDNWFITIPSPGKLSLKERFLLYIDEKMFNDYITDMKNQLIGKELNLTSTFAMIIAKK